MLSASSEGGGFRSPSFSYDYWRSGQGLGNITPAGKQWPEGDGFAGALRRLFAGKSVLEFGCGVGRLAPCFAPDLYAGVDICRHALDIAQERNPNHTFQEIDDSSSLANVCKAADATFAHTVLLHVPDDELVPTLQRFHTPLVVVSEIMGRRWRRAGVPPVFNREVVDYAFAMHDAGYFLNDRTDSPYPHYPATKLTMLFFNRL